MIIYLQPDSIFNNNNRLTMFIITGWISPVLFISYWNRQTSGFLNVSEHQQHRFSNGSR